MRGFWTLALLAISIACHPPRFAAPVATGEAHRVVLVSLDGLAADYHHKMLQAGQYRDPEGLAAFASRGLDSRALPPNPSLTAVGHATIATGRLPQDHGIVGNRFHLSQTPLGTTVSGFDHPWKAPALWEIVRRKGGKAGVITFPGCDGTTPERSADFFMVYVNRPSAPSRVLELEPEKRENLSWLYRLAVPLQRGNSRQEVTFIIRALEPSESGEPWRLQVPTSTQDSRTVQVGEWFPLTLRLPHADGGEQTLGAWCLAKSIIGQPPKLLLYQGGFFAAEAQPRGFRELVEQEAGFWPGPPDDRSLAEGLQGRVGLTLAEYGQQLERFSQFFTKATLAAIRHMDFDLLLTYQPVVDEAQHALTLTDPRQPLYSPGLAAAASEFLTFVYQVADRAVGAVAKALDLSRDSLVVVSDHGIHPVWAQVNLHAWLKREGLCPILQEPQAAKLTADCRLWAVQGGGVAHLYLNLASADPPGLSIRVRSKQVLLQASQGLARLEAAGQGAVEMMAGRDRLQIWELSHPNSGDLVVFPQPGIVFGGGLQDPLLAPPPYLGAHGFLNHHPSMAAVFLARGAGVKPMTSQQTSLKDVAPLVAQLLGFSL